MALDLVTGYKGTAHITAEDVGAFNAGIFGSGEYVLNSGNKFSASLTSNNTVKILDGDLVMQGRHITLKKDTFEEVTIENGTSGMNRIDLIVARYTKDSNTGVENVAFAVIKGTPTSSTATDPEYTTGDILSGACTLHEMPLYRISLSGLTAGTPEAMFEVVNSFDNGDLPITSSEEDTPAKWFSLGNGAWNVSSSTQGKILGLKDSFSSGTFINRISKGRTRSYVEQIFLSNKSMYLRVGDVTDGWDGEITGKIWKRVKTNYENPVVTGTYSGNGEYSQFIEIGFVPKAVFVSRSDGSMVRSHWGSGYGSYFYGGLALNGLDCNFWDGYSDYPIFKFDSMPTEEVDRYGSTVYAHGITVYNCDVTADADSANAYIRTNDKSTFFYVAFNY